jgi:hypothetical protein
MMEDVKVSNVRERWAGCRKEGSYPAFVNVQRVSGSRCGASVDGMKKKKK